MTIPEDFKTRLKIAKSKMKKQVQSDSEKRGSFMGSAFKLGTELVAAVAVGTIIGFILDSWFDTKPWLIIIFFFLGAAAGLLNVIRTANQIQKQIQSDNEKKGSFLGSAFKLGTELVAAVAVGTIIGFILDSWFDTKPWLIIIFFFLGTAAGILNVIRTANRMQKEN